MGDAPRIVEGGSVPAVEVFLGAPGKPHRLYELLAGKRAVVFGVPGAFTPGCSKKHLPGYVERSDELRRELNLSDIYCIAVNDSFVMEAWGQAHNAAGKVTMVADPSGAATRAMGLGMDFPGLGGLRSRRFAMIVENGVVERLFDEPDGRGMTCSIADNLLNTKKSKV
jgi:peroxiredoxin 5